MYSVPTIKEPVFTCVHIEWLDDYTFDTGLLAFSVFIFLCGNIFGVFKVFFFYPLKS